MNFIKRKESFQLHFYYLFVVSTIIVCSILLVYGFMLSNAQDFSVFYDAAKAGLSGKSIYITSGENHLPFLSPPWGAWFYIPFAILPKSLALIFYIAASVVSLILSINSLTKYYTKNFKLLDKIFIFFILIPMNFLLILVGQMDYILLGMAVLIIFAIEQENSFLAGMLIPILWIKIHLFIVLTLYAFWRGGTKTTLISLGFTSIMILIQSFISPGWQYEMIENMSNAAQRSDYLWNFTTLPNLLGSQENWLGTANLPFTFLLFFLAAGILYFFRDLPTVPFLSLALTASLFCAPRAYAYDLPMLIPTMIWLSAKNFRSNVWIWLAGAIIPLATELSSRAYILTLLIFGLGIFRAYQTLFQENLLKR